MELPFEKTVCRYWKQKFNQLHEQEQTQELRLSDGMPDVGRVISSWGQIVLRGKEWNDRNVGISGGVMVWVLYQPEDGSSPMKLETWVPFQSKLDMHASDEDGFIRVQCVLRSLDARITSTRKLMVRCGIGLVVQTMIPAELEMFVPPELPDDLEVLRNSYPITLTREIGEKTFSLDEMLELSGGPDQIEELLYYQIDPEILDQKVLGSKAVFRGQGNLHILYRDGDGRLACHDFEIPFAQYMDLDNDYEEDAQASNLICVTSLELDKEEDGTLHLRCGMVSQCTVQAKSVFEYIEDAYSPCRDVELTKQPVTFSAQLDSQQKSVECSQLIPGEGNIMVDGCFFQGLPRSERDADQLKIGLEGQFCCLMESGTEGLTQKNGKATVQMPYSTHCTTDTVCFSWRKGRAAQRREGADWRVDTQVILDISSICNQTLEAVSSMQTGAQRAPDPERPSVIIRARGEEERLWDIAKRCGSTVSAIERMNALEGEPEADRLLLIPVI